MPKLLNSPWTLDFHQVGFVFPISALTESEAAHGEEVIRASQAPQAVCLLSQLDCPWTQKAYLLFPWLDQLIRHPAILDAVEVILGSDLFVLGGDLFIKQPHDPRFISWHQDANYWQLEPLNVITAWVAITESTVANGCMRFSPRTHLTKLHHNETISESNMLTRGQTIRASIDESTAVCVELKPGEFSLHHAQLAHASGSNLTDGVRIGFAIRYVSSQVKQLAGPPISAMRVRGCDRHHHFQLESRPNATLDPEAIAAHRRALLPHKATRFSTS
ncbi:MAG TPA: phytanoyl-CoA dioxygenase family protein [Elainellaceae cyanobacterium]